MKAIIHKLIFRGNKLHRVEVSHPWYPKIKRKVKPKACFIAIDPNGDIWGYHEKPVRYEYSPTDYELNCWDVVECGECRRIGSTGGVLPDWRRSLCEIVLPELIGVTK